MSAPADNPGVKVPPPLFYVSGFLAGAALEKWAARLAIGPRQPLAAIGWCLALAALAFAAWAMITFWRARTAIIPHRPASRLVRHGPYRFTRNPMYVALTTLYVGLALLFNIAWPLLFLPIVLLAMTLFVIRREERYLLRTFGEDYARFMREVRRWV
ncbi:MAG TPA: isoprenylcysteine carboxylmethyltransferase family protein [Vicinamibacterales bacterium]